MKLKRFYKDNILKKKQKEDRDIIEVGKKLKKEQ